MINTIIFDCFETCTLGHPDPETGIIKAFNIKDKDRHFVEQFTCATKYDNHADYLIAICKGIGIECSKENTEKIDYILSEQNRINKIDPELKPLLKTLREKGLKIGSISNMPNPDWDILKKEGLDHLFDARVNSWDIGIKKPNPKIFRLCLQKLNSQPQETLFIGDSMINDIGPSKGLGMYTLLIDKREKHPSIKDKITSLKQVLEFISKHI